MMECNTDRGREGESERKRERERKRDKGEKLVRKSFGQTKY